MRRLLSFLFALTLTLSAALGQGYAGVNNILFLAKDNSLPGSVVLIYSSCSSMLNKPEGTPPGAGKPARGLHDFKCASTCSPHTRILIVFTARFSMCPSCSFNF